VTSTPRILLLHAVAGAGHRRAAEAIADQLRERGALVALRDALHDTHPLFRALYVGGGLGLITRLPRLYGMAYRVTDYAVVDRVIRGPRHQAQQSSAARLLDAIDAFQPEAVISTHFLSSELCAGWRRSDRLRAPLYTVVTDFEPHRLWQHAGTDGYCVPTDAARHRLIHDGTDPSIVEVTGIPIQREFSRLPDRGVARRRLRLDRDRPLIVIMGGGLGVGGIDALARSLLKHPIDAQIAFITGGNRALRRRLRQMSRGWSVRGFVDNMPDWLAAADIAISKAGGLAASELLAAGVPAIIPRVLTGHETLNANYFASTGAARLGASADEAVKLACDILANPAEQQAMKQAAQQAAKPNAAVDVAQIVLHAARLIQPHPSPITSYVAYSPVSTL
jgi:processive 1,2-diacylglycerol beta-glucosyltransferase